MTYIKTLMHLYWEAWNNYNFFWYPWIVVDVWLTNYFESTPPGCPSIEILQRWEGFQFLVGSLPVSDLSVDVLALNFVWPNLSIYYANTNSIDWPAVALSLIQLITCRYVVLWCLTSRRTPSEIERNPAKKPCLGVEFTKSRNEVTQIWLKLYGLRCVIH